MLSSMVRHSLMNLCRHHFTNRPVVCHNFKRCLHASCIHQSQWATNDAFADPMKQLEPLLQVPLLRPEDKLFHPSQEELEQAQDMFREKKGRPIQALKGVVNLDDLPRAHLPEVAFVGRSNVGKSSLINALFHHPASVRITVSKKPGHTRVLKFYTIDKYFSLVDMPGYGHNMPEYFVTSMERYMETRKTLCRVFLLIDGQVGLTSTDHTGIQMLEEIGKPYVLVLTKVDKTSLHKVLRNLLDILAYREKHMNGCLPQPFLVSAHQNTGLAQLRTFIAYVTANISLHRH